LIRKLTLALGLVLLATIPLTSAAGATGEGEQPATQRIGSTCVATDEFPSGPQTLMTSFKSTSLPPDASFGGVITSWRVNLGHDFKPVELRLSVLTLVGRKNRVYAVVGQSATETAGPGSNVFKTYLPIAAGEQIGISNVGGSAFPVCETTPAGGDGVWIRAHGAPLGTNDTGGNFHPASGFQIPVEATVEEILKGNRDRS
jgi:hypothetical protein